jgi:hypothetical protein
VIDHLARQPPAAHDELLAQLCRTTGLPTGVAARLLDDVLAFFDETAEQFVRRRHRELQKRGRTNDQIFEQISAELPRRRVVPSEFSVRQLRRLVYG